MSALLGWILSGIELIGTYVLWAIETAWNGLMDAITVAIAALFALLPAMAGSASIGDPDWLHWLNWLYPLGDLLTVLTGVVAMWVTWLVVRYGLKLLRAA